jgi:hypothetical protein
MPVRREEQRELLHAEASSLWFRIKLMNWSIRLCVGGALTVCLVVVSLFVGIFVDVNLSVVVAILFVLAMLLIISGLLFLLKEVGIATSRMQQGMEGVLEEALQDILNYRSQHRDPGDPGDTQEKQKGRVNQ